MGHLTTGETHRPPPPPSPQAVVGKLSLDYEIKPIPRPPEER